jgi:hypothetical protein
MLSKGFNIFSYKFKSVFTMPILNNLRIVGSFLLRFTNWVLLIHFLKLIFLKIFYFIFNNKKTSNVIIIFKKPINLFVALL